jgi:hypothetical protein
MRDVCAGLRFAVPGAGGQETRFGCEFGSFFSCVDGATPGELLTRGVYSEIAVALKGGPWREASMAMLAMALGLSKAQAEAQASGQDVLGKGLSEKLDTLDFAERRRLLSRRLRSFEARGTRSSRVSLFWGGGAVEAAPGGIRSSSSLSSRASRRVSLSWGGGTVKAAPANLDVDSTACSADLGV